MSRTSLFLLGVALATPALLPAAPVPEAKTDDCELHVVGLHGGVTRTGDTIHGGMAWQPRSRKAA